MARFSSYRGARNYRSLSSGSSQTDSMWVGITLGIIAGLILMYALCKEGSRCLKDRAERRRLKAKRKLNAVKELEM